MDGLITFLNSTGKSFVDFALPMLIQSSMLIIVLLGLDLILRKKAKAVLRYWIWMLVLVKLVLPTTFSSPTSPGYWFGGKLPGIVTEKSFTAEESEIISPVVEPVESATLPESIVASPPVKVTNPQSVSVAPVESDIVIEPAMAASPITWQALVFLGWLVVVVTMVLLSIQRTFFVRGLIAQSKNARGTIVDIFEQCCEQIGIHKRVALKLSPVAASPSVCGLFRPTILIPRALPDKLDSRHLKSVLLHELAHIKRGDLWVSFIQTMLQIAYIYNPLLWVANAVIRKIREQAVDEMVLVAMGEQAEDYPATLLNISRLTFSRPALSLRLIGVVESKKALSGRIKHILRRPFPKSAKLGILGLIGVIIAAAVLIPMAKREDVAIGEGPEREMTLTLGWSGEKVKIPAPVVFPEWGRKTKEFKRWEKIGDVRTFTTYDIEGYKYVAHALGFSTDSNGARHETIPSVERFRRDGTLEADTTYNTYGKALDWRLYDEQGRKKVYVANRFGAKDEKRSVVFYDGDGKETKSWQVSEFDVVYAELVTDPNGRRYFSHYLKELKHCPYPKTFTATLPNGVKVKLVGVRL